MHKPQASALQQRPLLCHPSANCSKPYLNVFMLLCDLQPIRPIYVAKSFKCLSSRGSHCWVCAWLAARLKKQLYGRYDIRLYWQYSCLAMGEFVSGEHGLPLKSISSLLMLVDLFVGWGSCQRRHRSPKTSKCTLHKCLLCLWFLCTLVLGLCEVKVGLPSIRYKWRPL